MKIFLTSQNLVSTRVDGVKVDTNIDKSNRFLENVKESLERTSYLLYIAVDINDYEHNDLSAKLIKKAFEKEGIIFDNLLVLDYRTIGKAEDYLIKADLIFLPGGFVPAQLETLAKINFRMALRLTHGIIIGQSAGSMSLSRRVYFYPETDEEVDLPKFYDGIGVVDIHIIPHFNTKNGNNLLTGNFDLINDYYIPDSKTYSLTALCDGSYVIFENGKYTAYGDVYQFKDCSLTKICGNGESVEILI